LYSVVLGCTRLYSVVLGCIRLLYSVVLGCTRLYSVVLATFSTDVTIQRQNHSGHRSSSNVSVFFIFDGALTNSKSIFPVLLACSQVLVESSETARPDRGPDFDESGDQKDGQDTNEQGQTRRKPQFCVLDHCPTGPSPFRRQEKKGHVDEFHGRTFVPPQIQKGRFQRRFQDRRGSFAHGSIR